LECNAIAGAESAPINAASLFAAMLSFCARWTTVGRWIPLPPSPLLLPI